jgi:hypothetical protein
MKNRYMLVMLFKNVEKCQNLNLFLHKMEKCYGVKSYLIQNLLSSNVLLHRILKWKKTKQSKNHVINMKIQTLKKITIF